MFHKQTLELLKCVYIAAYSGKVEHVNTHNINWCVSRLHLHQYGVQLHLQAQALFAVFCDFRAATDSYLCDLSRLLLLLLQLNHSISVSKTPRSST